jgi:hypothetical protein
MVSIIAISHNLARNTTVVLALRTSPYDRDLIHQALNLRHNLVGHPLLIPTVLIEIGLATNMRYMQTIRQKLAAIEAATGKHDWLRIPATEASTHNSEISNMGHTAKIHISTSERSVNALRCWLRLLQEALTEFERPISESFAQTAGPRKEYEPG